MQNHTRNHPIQQWPADVRAATVGISVHGDEGQGKRDRSVLVISWSAVGISGKTFHCRFPFAAPWINAMDMSI